MKLNDFSIKVRDTNIYKWFLNRYEDDETLENDNIVLENFDDFIGFGMWSKYNDITVYMKEDSAISDISFKMFTPLGRINLNELPEINIIKMIKIYVLLEMGIYEIMLSTDLPVDLNLFPTFQLKLAHEKDQLLKIINNSLNLHHSQSVNVIQYVEEVFAENERFYISKISKDIHNDFLAKALFAFNGLITDDERLLEYMDITFWALLGSWRKENMEFRIRLKWSGLEDETSKYATIDAEIVDGLREYNIDKVVEYINFQKELDNWD